MIVIRREQVSTQRPIGVFRQSDQADYRSWDARQLYFNQLIRLKCSAAVREPKPKDHEKKEALQTIRRRFARRGPRLERPKVLPISSHRQRCFDTIELGSALPLGSADANREWPAGATCNSSQMPR